MGRPCVTRGEPMGHPRVTRGYHGLLMERPMGSPMGRPCIIRGYLQ